MARIGYQRFLGLRIAAPENKNDGIGLFVHEPNDLIGKWLPALSLMGIRLTMPDCQDRVQKQNPLVRPAAQIPVRWRLNTKIRLKLLIYVQQ